MSSSLFQCLKESSLKYPHKSVVVKDGVSITYDQLYKQACSIAAFLIGKGFKKASRVSLLIENSAEYIAAYYGVLAAGGIVVGLNAASKSRDLINWIEHSDSAWLVADGQHVELPEILSVKREISCILIGEQEYSHNQDCRYSWKKAIECCEKIPDTENPGNNNELAAIIYTSGTTGKPKGVTLSHSNFVHNIKSIISYLKLTNKDKVMNVLPFYYSYGNSVLHTHIAAGGTIYLENSLMYPHKILQVMQDEEITGFSGVPSTYSLLLSRTEINKYDLSSLRYMTQAGGAMAPSNISRLTSELPETEFFVMYGQTEATARLSYLPPEKLKSKLGSIGIAIPGVSLAVKDDSGKNVPPGEIGQICAKGPNIMHGYWKDPEATNRVIVNGWLLTGDLAKQDEDGYIYIVGRSSEMIKSGANRISPKDIEEVIDELESVEEVAVVGRRDEILGEVIEAYIVTSPGTLLDRKKVLAHCRKNLATYKIPKNIVFVNELPKTASGKVKRYLLAGDNMASSQSACN